MKYHIEKHIATLIFLYLQDKLTAAETEELNEWRAASLSHESLFQRITSQQYLEDRLHRFVKTREETAVNWQKLQARMHPDKTVFWKQAGKYAAIASILITVGSLWFYHSLIENKQPEIVLTLQQGLTPGHPTLILPDGKEINLQDTASRSLLSLSENTLSVTADSLRYGQTGNDSDTAVYHTLKIPRGAEYILTLSDHSSVHLNAGSELTYPVRFNNRERKVYLKGEAYFNIQKNAACPFMISVNQLKVTVTGTTFGIRAYEEENNISTTLESGHVSVSWKNLQTKLQPGEQAVFNKQQPTLKVRKVDTEVYLGWRKGRIIYDNCELETILRDLGKWYDVEVIYQKQELRSYKFSLNIKRHESLSKVLELLGTADNIRFEIKDHTVIVQ